MDQFIPLLTAIKTSPVTPWLGWLFLAFLAMYWVLSQINPDQALASWVEDFRQKMGADGLPTSIFLVIAALWAILFLTLFIGLLLVINDVAWGVVDLNDQEGVWNFRFLLAQLAGLTAVLGAVVALPFTAIRLRLNTEQTVVAQEGLVTDRINKAVENLGATRVVKRQRRRDSGKLAYEYFENAAPPKINYDKPIFEEISEPNLEVRIGAIYALERIARQNLDYHIQIMEILTTYVRENAPISLASTSPDEAFEGFVNNGMDHYQAAEKAAPLGDVQEAEDEWYRSLQGPRADIYAALIVIGRRSDKQIRAELSNNRHTKRAFLLDFRRTSLQGADLSRLSFQNALIEDTALHGANFTEAGLKHADFTNASLKRVSFRNSDLRGVNFRWSKAERADFGSSIWDDATLTLPLFWSGASLQRVDLSRTAIDQSLIKDCYGDRSTLLPSNCFPPEHWPNFTLSDAYFEHEWDLWRHRPSTYNRPSPPDGAESPL